jgi:nucleoside-diphosphate-sugar epimerase
MSKKILVIGATGYIGRKIIHRFYDEKFKVYALSRFSSHVDNEFSSKRAIEMITSREIRDIVEEVRSTKFDIIINAACSYGKDNEPYSEIKYVNFTLPIKIFEALTLSDQESSIFVNLGTVLEESESYYAATKQNLSNGLWKLAEQNRQTNLIDLKIGQVYGGLNNGKNFINETIDSCIKNVSEIRLKNGGQKRDFIYIDDLVEILFRLIKKASNFHFIKPVPIASREPKTIEEVVRLIKFISNSKLKIKVDNTVQPGSRNLSQSIDFLNFLLMPPQKNFYDGLVEAYQTRQIFLTKRGQDKLKSNV